MAALDSSQPRRKTATYGKPSHKRVQSYNYSDVFATSQRSQESLWDYDSKHQVVNSRGRAVGSKMVSAVARVNKPSQDAIRSMEQTQVEALLGDSKIVKRDRLQSPFNSQAPVQARNTTSSVFDVPSSGDEMEARKAATRHTAQTKQLNHKPSNFPINKRRDLQTFDSSDTTESNELDPLSASSTPRKRRKVVPVASQRRSPVDSDNDNSSQQRVSLKPASNVAAPPETLCSNPEQKRSCKGMRSPDGKYAQSTRPIRRAPSKTQGRQAVKPLLPEQRLERPALRKDDGGALERVKLNKKVEKIKPLDVKNTSALDLLKGTSTRHVPSHISLGSLQTPGKIANGGRTPSPESSIDSETRSKTPPLDAEPLSSVAVPRQARRLNWLLAEGISTESGLENSKPAYHTSSGCERPDVSETAMPRAQAPNAVKERPRKRLIDSLAVGVCDALAAKGPSGNDTGNDTGAVDTDAVSLQTRLLTGDSHDPAESPPQGGSQGSAKPPSAMAPVAINAPLGSQRGGPKITYAQQRSFLSDSVLDETAIFDAPLSLKSEAHCQGGRRNARGFRPVPGQLQSLDQEEDTVDDANGGAIRSIHELREAGGNKRFLDEMEALFEDIEDRGDSSLSRRRSALLELGSKLVERGFPRRFVENNFGQRLFVRLDAERDIIVSTVLASAIISTMDDAATTHSVLKLHQEGAVQMLLRLLDSDRDISLVARERRMNMSKVAQSLVSDFRELIKDSSMWTIGAPRRISPRLIALRCLELIIRRLREEGTTGLIFPQGTADKIVQVLAPFSMWQSQIEPTATDRVELELTLSILESYAINVGSIFDESTLTAESLNIISRTLPSVSRWKEDNFKQVILLALRLHLSITNNNPVICDAFARPELLNVLVDTVRSKFKCLSGFLEEEQRLYELDVLVLGLGLLINFAELSDAARLSLVRGGGDRLLEALLRTFLDRLEKAAEADSMEESQSNVAFGYLSVLLGSLCQNSDIRELLRSKLPGGTLQPLVSAVDEFIQHHRKVDDLYDGDDRGDSGNRFTQRLQVVVDRLKQSEGLR
ncbi:hypothetical protein GP486_005255 [Trichoglossum hirsutum]|uniref:Wings apart-like protein C-terminal domain-containing protein n=1 Tax=Trichoglossum hirsutum TaxID=265104 RepID=A0A9P8RMM0_9PEZI|nr:hypothetical protein GP486_005255 [Trichoglossum hirsutum]